MTRTLSRREFLQLAGAALGGLALGWLRFANRERPFIPDFPQPPDHPQGLLVRVAGRQVDVRARPDDQAPIVGNRFRDQVLHVYEVIRPPNAPQFYNPVWYRVWGGYMHSAHLQEVEIRLNDPWSYIPEGGQLCEVTVPYTTAYQRTRQGDWARWRGSRLYYSSTHWATGVEEGPDGQPWYRIVSELSETEVYYVPAIHLRPIPPEEWAPIASEVPPEKKRIEVSIKEQILRAYEYDEVVFTARISSGIPNPRLDREELPTATPTGKYVIYSKMPSKHMGSVAGGEEVEDNGGFSLPGVPWTCFFRNPGGYALHGTYWHNNFGVQMSHGCVNMRNADALWLFRWTTPVFDPTKIHSRRDWERTGHGTTVIIY